VTLRTTVLTVKPQMDVFAVLSSAIFLTLPLRLLSGRPKTATPRLNIDLWLDSGDVLRTLGVAGRARRRTYLRGWLGCCDIPVSSVVASGLRSETAAPSQAPRGGATAPTAVATPPAMRRVVLAGHIGPTDNDQEVGVICSASSRGIPRDSEGTFGVELFLCWRF
jgi:hypothetical protein